MDKIKFYLPDFYNKFALNQLIINMMKTVMLIIKILH